MSNTISYAQIFQKALDKQMVAAATSGWMETNAGQVIYNGGNTVKVPKLSTDGLGDYDRACGYKGGAITFEYETKTLTQDRSRSFLLDAMDVDETNFVASASMVMSEFQRTKVIPEIDAYRYSSLATQFITAGKVTYGYNPTADTILKTLKSQIDAVKDAIGDTELVVSISRVVLGLLEQGTRLEKVNFTSGDIQTEVSSIDGVPLLPVPSARMKTAYVFNDGSTVGQEVGGFVAAGAAKDVNWIITPRTAPIAISKQEAPKIINPAINQDADAWKIAYRKYHDVWILDNKLAACHVCVKQAQV
ncbi:hypothetical protein [Clostridium sp.]|uniref:hypothetical protein n=1 Tax=Clostridium sp. TaxID=1506 RepID=UPI003217BE92